LFGNNIRHRGIVRQINTKEGIVEREKSKITITFRKYCSSILALCAIIIIPILPGKAAGGSLVTNEGVVLLDGSIAFPSQPNFLVDHVPGSGIYTILINKPLNCRHDGGLQAALGQRLATSSANDLLYVVTQLKWVTSDILDVCNDVAAYQFIVRSRLDNSLVDGVFSFQITGELN